MYNHQPLIKNPAQRMFGQVARFIAVVLLLLFTVEICAAANLSASVDRKQIGLQETLTLSVRYDEQVMFGEPDFNVLNKDFEIRSNRRANQYRSINGQVESFTQWSLTLAPRREGQLQIPALELEGQRSDPIDISVTKSMSETAANSDQPIFLETELDKDSVYVQEQVLLKLRLFTAIDLIGLNSEELKVDNALVKQVSENQYQRIIDGQHFGVVEVTYAIFPQQSGTLTLPALMWDVQQQLRSGGFSADPFFNRRSGKRLSLRSEEKVIEVKPGPADFSGSGWLPAQNIELQQSWSRDPSKFRVGEPITRKLEIQAQGLMASQIPPLSHAPGNDVRYYADQPQHNEILSPEGVTSLVTESYAIVPNRPGKIVLPAIDLHWWDTKRNRERVASLPAQTIQVAASTTGTAAAPIDPTGEPASDQFDVSSQLTSAANLKPAPALWIFCTLLFFSTSVLFATLWLRARRADGGQSAAESVSTLRGSNEKAAWKRLQTTLENDDKVQIRESLMRWAAAFLAPAKVQSLEQVAGHLPALRPGIERLQASLYSGRKEHFDSDAFKQTLAQVRHQRRRQAGNNAGESLAPLYPG